MDFLKQYWTQIQAQLSALDRKSRVLIVSLTVILLLTGFLIVYFASTPDYVTLDGFAAANQSEVVARLEARGINVKTEGTSIMVKASQRMQAISVLAESQLLAEDTTSAFDDYIEKQNLWRSDPQDERAMLVARAKVLGQMVRRMKGVQSAEVVIDKPKANPFGQRSSNPTATVTVQLSKAGNMPKPMVDAIAGLVSGAVARMTPRDVQVIDMNNGRSFTVESEDQLLASTAMETMALMEKQYLDKVNGVLSPYIPNVIVGVNVEIDPKAREEIIQHTYQTDPGLQMKRSQEEENLTRRNGGEPGIRSNVGQSIEGGSSDITESKRTDDQQQFYEQKWTGSTRITNVGHLPKTIGVTVNVPRSYFVNVYLQSIADAKEDPSDEDLQPVISSQLTKIQEQVQPLVSPEGSNHKGIVQVNMIYDQLASEPQTAGGGGVLGMMDSEYAQPVGIVALSVVTLGLLFAMVRKATQAEPLPTIEEIAGVPPTLPTDEDLIGEVEESELDLAGVEVDEAELESRRMADQISELIKSNPLEASNVFKRWAQTED